ncbi:hypothetical protein CRG98_035300 [Punica granatum]|uniref:Uncharacterized protein n=1 Tax=Punica granatum TaxID=22663 RepID=A0A2I0IJY1_PUNGR|nr:hypothetical protein CRG98_035300 [Punica granatum]
MRRRRKGQLRSGEIVESSELGVFCNGSSRALLCVGPARRSSARQQQLTRTNRADLKATFHQNAGASTCSRPEDGLCRASPSPHAHRRRRLQDTPPPAAAPALFSPPRCQGSRL